MNAHATVKIVERGPMSKAEADQIVDWLQRDLDVHGAYDRGERGNWEIVRHSSMLNHVVLRILFKNPEDYAMFRLTWS